MGNSIIRVKQIGDRAMQVVENLFEQALNIQLPWKVKSVDFKETEKVINIHIDFERGSIFKCGKCGTDSKAYDTTEKKWRHLNFFQYESYIIARVPRTDCKECGVLLVDVPWARRSSDCTYLFDSLMMILCREMPVNRVSQIMKEDDEKLWRIIHHYTEEARKLEDYSDVKAIGVDETSKKKGHDYVTLFVDLEDKKTIFVTEGKGSETVKQFKEDFENHNGIAENIKDASIDMSPAFIKGIEETFPNAEITFDKFHIMKIINNAVDEVRRNEVKEQIILRGKKYIFLKNREELTENQKEELRKIEFMPYLNLQTIRAFHIRENFQSIYTEQTKEEFELKLHKWYFWATHSRLKPICEAAKTIKRHWSGVTRWYESRINNGILEGLNSLVQAAKAKARGYRTFKNLKVIIYMLTGKLDYTKVGLPT